MRHVFFVILSRGILLVLGGCLGNLPDGSSGIGGGGSSRVGNGGEEVEDSLSDQENTYVLEFESSLTYTYNSTLITLANSTVSTASIDQTDDANNTLGFLGGTHSNTWWNSTHSALELTSSSLSGVFTSRIINAQSSVAWNTLGWVPYQAYGKDLPDYVATETVYSGLNVSMSNNVVLYHFSNSSYTGAANEVLDTSGQGNHATTTASATASSLGKINYGIYLDNANADQVSIPSSSTLSSGGPYQNRTFMIWFYVTGAISDSTQILDFGDTNTGLGLYLYNSKLYAGAWDSNYGFLPSFIVSGTLSANTWYHAAIVLDGGSNTVTSDKIKIYLNGSLLGSMSGTQLSSQSNATLLGAASGSQYHTSFVIQNFTGILDEFAVFNRALTSAEINGIYLRGAGNLKFQIRSCDDSSCTGETWVGSDGTAATYYTEDDFSDNLLPSVSINTGFVTSNRYFQYRVYLSSIDTAVTPLLKSVTAGPVHYATGGSVVNQIGPAFKDFTALSVLSATMGTGNGGSVNYQLSLNGTSWYYHNGTSWVAAASSAQSNTQTQVTTYLKDFDSQVGIGTLYVRCYLIPGSSTPAVLDRLSIGPYRN